VQLPKIDVGSDKNKEHNNDGLRAIELDNTVIKKMCPDYEQSTSKL